jgi:hypothetical protein
MSCVPARTAPRDDSSSAPAARIAFSRGRPSSSIARPISTERIESIAVKATCSKSGFAVYQSVTRL